MENRSKCDIPQLGIWTLEATAESLIIIFNRPCQVRSSVPKRAICMHHRSAWIVFLRDSVNRQAILSDPFATTCLKSLTIFICRILILEVIVAIDIMALRSTLRREFDLFMSFSWRDWSASIIPSSIFAVGALKDLPYHMAIRNYVLVLLWVVLYIYPFDLFTQSMSLSEDLINKPDRPIPSGKISIDAALKRCMIAWAAFFAISVWHTQIIPETVTWLLVTIFLGATQAGGHWIGKNVLGMSIGSWALLSPSRKLICPQTTEHLRHILALSFWAAFITHAQDFRDQNGDRKVRRGTLPISFGDQTTRYVFAFALAPLAFLSTYFFDLAKNAPWLLATMHVLVAYRFLKFRNARSDHKTYMVRIQLDLQCSVSPR